jgi:hypothetical protein
MSLEMAHKVIVPPKKNYVPQFLKQRDINSYYGPNYGSSLVPLLNHIGKIYITRKDALLMLIITLIISAAATTEAGMAALYCKSGRLFGITCDYF